MPLLAGLLSLWLGADRNFDLINYHLYDAYAFLQGRLATDLAPAGMQSYFNPLLDLPYYWMSQHLPPMLVGFLMGLLHGLNFVVLLAIARKLLPELPEQDRYRGPLLLALAGCLTANFLSEFGNSMGDDSTALLVLLGVYLLVMDWEAVLAAGRRGLSLALLGGFAVGIAAGLKLTNAVYAVALCAGLFLAARGLLPRLRLSFTAGIGVLLGLALAGGYWWLLMWQHFHNPLFPQFSSLFPNPLALKVSVADTSWLPKNLPQRLLWPLLISLDSHRVGQLSLHQVIWALVYGLFIAWAVTALRRRLGKQAAPAVDGRQVFILAFVAVAFVVWMLIFSIGRYLVSAELLAPLVLFLLCLRLWPYLRARRIAGWALTLATLLVLLGGVKSWGHESWGSPLFQADVPPLSVPDKTTVLIFDDTQPNAWLATQFPAAVAFAGVHQDFPESGRYMRQVHEMAATRGGPAYAIVQAHTNWRVDSLAKSNATATRLGLESGPRGCGFLSWASGHLHLHAGVSATAGGGCDLTLLPEDAEDTAAEDRASATKAADILPRYGFNLDPAQCRVYPDHIGQGTYAYQWCPLTDSKAKAL